MRILYAVHQFFPECYTGTEQYTLALAKQMQRMGHDVTVLTYAVRSLVSQRQSDGPMCRVTLEHEQVPIVALQHADLFTRRGGISGVSFDIGDAAVRDAVSRLIEERGFDLLHCTHPMRVGAAIEAAEERRLPVALHLMDYWLLCPQGILMRADSSLCHGPDGGRNCAAYCYGAPMAQVLAARVRAAEDILAKVDLVVSPSRFLIEMFERNGIDTSRFVWSPYGFDFSKLRPRPTADRDGTVTFGFIGTVLPHKGVHVLIDAFKRVRLDNVRLRIWGGFFDQHDYYAALLAAAREDQRITFEGEYDFNDIATVIDRVDAVVVPSIWYENAPIVISAAQARGVPVVTSAMGGMAEMVQDKVAGVTFIPGDAEALSEQLLLLGSQPALLKEMGLRCVPPPRIEAEAMSMELFYQSMIQEGRDPDRRWRGTWVPPGLFPPPSG